MDGYSGGLERKKNLLGIEGISIAVGAAGRLRMWAKKELLGSNGAGCGKDDSDQGTEEDETDDSANRPSHAGEMVGPEG